MSEVENEIEVESAPVSVDGESAETPSSEEEQVEEVSSGDANADPYAKFDELLTGLGEVSEEPLNDLLSRYSADSIENLDPLAKTIIRQALARENQKRKIDQAKIEEERSGFDAKRKQLAEDRAEIIRMKAQWGQMFANPEFNRQISDAENVEIEENADLTDPANIDKLIAKKTAEGLKKFQDPFAKMAAEARREEEYLDFRKSHPKTDDPKFKRKMLQVKADREKSGETIKDRAYLYALTENVLFKEAEDAIDRARRKEHARSASKVSKASNSSTSTTRGIPDHVRKNGYKGEKGRTAINLWLLDNKDGVKQVNGDYYS
tara:strand:- start:805 stop:1764 length:960 start_codon:yes stop_codon:yes gene_type:complete